MSVVDRTFISSDITVEWSQWLERRVMRLLFQYDQRLFRGEFRIFFVESILPDIPVLQQYDRYIRLLTLSDELLDNIMPRVRRQLSLQTNRKRIREEAPTRGDIDWQRTLERTWRELPGLAPIDFDTHLRQRSTSTPENLLVVVILLAYRQELKNIQVEGMNDEVMTNQERQLLVGMDERAERELAAPYARALLGAASQADPDALVKQVISRLRPGKSPYRDLIDWWQRFNDLSIGYAPGERRLSLTSRQRDDSDAWLYELWVALELAHFLYEKGALQPIDTNVDLDCFQFTFTWHNRKYRFLYNRNRYKDSTTNGSWESEHTLPPSYIIERENPLKIYHEDMLIWLEPPFVMSTQYYLTNNQSTSIDGSIKKLLGDMMLLNAEHGALFLPLLSESQGEERIIGSIKPNPNRYHVGTLQNTQIEVYQLSPNIPIPALQTRLEAILEHALRNLPERTEPACHGIWLDPDSINTSGTPVPPNTILCPKRHIGPGVFDLVDAERDCLKNPKVCHVIGQAIVRPEVIRITTREALFEKSSSLRKRGDKMLHQAEQSGNEERTEQLRNYILNSVGNAVEQYVALRGDTGAIEDYFKMWIFRGYWKEGKRSLAIETCNMLLSGEYVWHECTRITLDDWAAPAIQYCRALEFEFRRRIYNHRPKDFKLHKRRWTLGTPEYLYSVREATQGDDAHDWTILKAILTQSQCDMLDFENILQRLASGRISHYRNQLAHGDPIPRNIAQALRETVIGHAGNPGILYWLAQKLDPKQT